MATGFNIKLVFAMWILFLLYSCQKEPIIKEYPDLIKELNATPESLQFNSSHLILKTYLSRDFMPGFLKLHASGLFSDVKLIERDSQDIHDLFALKFQFVVQDNKAWMTPLSLVSSTANENYLLEGFSKNGPTWDTDKPVNVIAVFQHLSSGKEYRIMSRNQEIARTY